MATPLTADRDLASRANQLIDRCRLLASHSEQPGSTTRMFLTAPMRSVHASLTEWMGEAGMSVAIDAAGNIRGSRPAASSAVARLFIGSHLDTVPNAGAFDGVLGVVLGIGLVESLGRRQLPFAIEVVGFSDEEGARFGIPFIGSRAFTGTLDDNVLEAVDASGTTVRDAIHEYGLDPDRTPDARATGALIGYVEFHIEQGPVLERLGLPLGIVDLITGLSRVDVVFTGAARHAGTTPMAARRDAVTCAAEWALAVERHARDTLGLVATVGRFEAEPGATNVIAGRCRCSLDLRHADDEVRASALARARREAATVAARRGLDLAWTVHLDQPATHMDRQLVGVVARAVEKRGFTPHIMSSGAGHDAMIVARVMPSAVLFLRSPGGISHHPDESVRADDVAAALAVGQQVLEELAEQHG